MTFFLGGGLMKLGYHTIIFASQAKSGKSRGSATLDMQTLKSKVSSIDTETKEREDVWQR